MIYCIELVSEKTCEKSFSDVHFIVNLLYIWEFVWYSSIVVGALVSFRGFYTVENKPKVISVV